MFSSSSCAIQSLIPRCRLLNVRNVTTRSKLRAFPEYSIYGPDCLLSVKVIFPTFQLLPKSNILSSEGRSNGRILLEWLPRLPTGKLDTDSKLRFALNPEECGLLIDQLPNNPIELTRLPSMENSTESTPLKVFRASPAEGGAVNFLVDFELNGVGGQSPTTSVAGSLPPVGPLQITAQRGEYIVLQEIVRSSIPTLVMWDLKMQLAQEARIDSLSSTSSSSSGHGNSGHGGYDDGFNTSVPF